MLPSLKREVKMELGLPGDHSDSSHCLSLWGLRIGCSSHVGVGSLQVTPGANPQLRVQSLVLDTSSLQPRKSRSLIRQVCSTLRPTRGRPCCSLTVHWGPRGFSARHCSPQHQASRRLYSARAEDFFTPSQIRAA